MMAITIPARTKTTISTCIQNQWRGTHPTLASQANESAGVRCPAAQCMLPVMADDGAQPRRREAFHPLLA